MFRRTFVLNNFHRFGVKTGKRLIKYAYAIFLSDFIKKSKAPKFASRFEMYEQIINEKELAASRLQYLEFGVFKGESIKFWALKNNHVESGFYGFDSFEGLPEDWFPGMRKGVFNVGGKLPDINDERIHFVKGWFNETLPGFVEHVQPDSSSNIILHLDADLYSSTYYVLNCLYYKNYIKKGTILIFDEAIVASIADTEFRAFYDFMQVVNLQYEVLGIAKFEMAIIIK